MPVDGRPCRQLVGYEDPNLVALDDPDRRAGDRSVEGESLLLHARCHVPGVGRGLQLEDFGAVGCLLVIGEDRAVPPGHAGEEALRPSAAGARIGADADIAGKLVGRGEPARRAVPEGRSGADVDRTPLGEAPEEHSDAHEVHGQGQRDEDTEILHRSTTPSSGPGGRVLEVVVDGAGGASGSPAVEGGTLPSGFSTITLPSM